MRAAKMFRPVVLLSFLLMGLTAGALALNLEQAALNDFQALLDDTVNEGEQQARITDISCVIRDHRGQSDTKWAFCRLDFEVSYEDRSETRSCRVTYTFKPNTARLSLERMNDDQFAECTEHLGESVE